MYSDLTAYLFGDIICIVFMMIIIRNSKRQLGILFSEKIFLEMLLTTVIIIMDDVIWVMVNGNGPKLFHVMNTVCSGFYFIMTGIMGLVWIMYADYKLFGDSGRKYMIRSALYSVPAIILTVMTLLSPWFHLIYYVDSDNNYHRGTFYLVQLSIGGLYMIAALVMSCVQYHRQKRPAKKRVAAALIEFTIFPMLGAVLQAIISDLPLMTVGATISILLIFMNVQNGHVSLDALTGIFNRRQLNMYLDGLLDEKKNDKNLFFFLMDIDKFKSINDTYGHLEGDNAICNVADMLSEVCDKQNDFLARYGGDEFAVVCRRADREDAELFINHIEDALKKQNEINATPYNLELSIGYSQFYVDGSNQDDIISIADQKLYQIKQAKKQKASTGC